MVSRNPLYIEPPAHLSPVERARHCGLEGPTLCEIVASGAHSLALSEAGHRLARGDLAEAFVWIERAHPGLHGLARAVAAVTGPIFGPAAARRPGMLDRAAGALRAGDVAEAVACIAGCRERLVRLPSLLNSSRAEG